MFYRLEGLPTKLNLKWQSITKFGFWDLLSAADKKVTWHISKQQFCSLAHAHILQRTLSCFIFMVTVSYTYRILSISTRAVCVPRLVSKADSRTERLYVLLSESIRPSCITQCALFSHCWYLQAFQRNKTLPSNISLTKANSQNIVATVSGKYDTFLPIWDLGNSLWPNKSRGFNCPWKSHMSRPFSCVPCVVLPWWYPIFCRLI